MGHRVHGRGRMSRQTYADSAPLSELIGRIDLVELVGSYTAGGKLVSGSHMFSCPNPDHPDHSASFTVRTNARGVQVARCWSQCAWRGDALDLVQWLDGGTKAEAAKKLRARLGEHDDGVAPRATNKPRTTPAPRPVNRPTVHSAEGAPVPPAESAGRIMAAHLAHRGWPAEVVERFGLTVVLDDHRRPCIRYPHHAWDGTTWAVCSWQDRATADVGPKWKAPSGAVLPPYNVQALDTLDDLAAVVVCEGAPDTITATLALAGRTDIVAVGIAGVNAWRTEWAPMLAAPVVIVAADPDKAGEKLPAAIMRDLGRPVIVLDLVGGDLTETAKAHGLAAVTALLATTVDEATSVVHEPTPQGAAPVTTDTVEHVSGTATDVMPAPPQWWDRWTALEALGPHRWRVCSTCGGAALASLGRRCLMTPECEGRYVPRAPQGVSA